jgi:hypothetical protein
MVSTRAPGATTWTAQLVDTVLEDSSVPAYGVVRPRLRRDGNGGLHVVYSTSVKPDSGSGQETTIVKYALSTGGAWQIETLGAGSAPAIALDKSGAPHVVFASSPGIPCTTCPTTYGTRTSAGWQTEVAMSQDFSLTAAIALDAKDTPSIVAASASAIRLATKGTSGWQVDAATLSTNGSGTSLDLFIDSTGAAHVGHSVFSGSGSYTHDFRSASGWQSESIAGTVGLTYAGYALTMGGGDQLHALLFTRMDLVDYEGLALASRVGTKWSTEPLTQTCTSGDVALAVASDDQPRVVFSCSAPYGDSKLTYYEPVLAYTTDRTANCQAAASSICGPACTCTGTAQCCYTWSHGSTCVSPSSYCAGNVAAILCGEATADPAQPATCVGAATGLACNDAGSKGVRIPAACDPAQ